MGWFEFVVSQVPKTGSPPQNARGDPGPFQAVGLRKMSYAAKEIFYTLQGEGAQAGRAAVFCRFAGCNLWSGREADRPDAICRFCDTDFVGVDGPGGGKFDSAEDLAVAIERQWPAACGQRFVVCTGGEPLLQLDAGLIAACTRAILRLPSKPTERRRAGGLGLALRQPQGRSHSGAAQRRRAEAGLSSAGALIRRSLSRSPSAISFTADGRPRPRRQHRTRSALLPQSSALAIELAVPQNARHSVAAPKALRAAHPRRPSPARSRLRRPRTPIPPRRSRTARWPTITWRWPALPKKKPPTAARSP
jgi:hypothetical protein